MWCFISPNREIVFFPLPPHVLPYCMYTLKWLPVGWIDCKLLQCVCGGVRNLSAKNDFFVCIVNFVHENWRGQLVSHCLWDSWGRKKKLFCPHCDKFPLSKNNRLIFKMSRSAFNLFQWSEGLAVSFIMHTRCPRESDIFSERWASLKLMKRHLQFSLYVNYAHVALSVFVRCGK